MPRQPNLEIRLKCNNCKDFTQTINPIIINKLTENRYHIKAVCSICNKFKTKFLNKKQIRLLPVEIKQAGNNTTFNNTIERNGGIIPLIPLIGAIAMGISALGGATASAIISAKNSAEDERHHKQLEQISSENNISNDVIKTDNDLQTPNNGKTITIDPKLAADIISLVLSVIKVLPSAINTLKTLINGNGIKSNQSQV